MSAPKHKGWWSSWYKRDGTPCASQDEARAIQKQNRVALDTVLDGRIVSTVHLGLDHRFGVGAPIIFETLVFPKEGDFGDIDANRYCTEAEAVAGHAAMVAKWKAPGAVGYEHATPHAQPTSEQLAEAEKRLDESLGVAEQLLDGVEGSKGGAA